MTEIASTGLDGLEKSEEKKEEELFFKLGRELVLCAAFLLDLGCYLKVFGKGR